MSSAYITAYMLAGSVQFILAGYQIYAKELLSRNGIDPVVFMLVRNVGTAVLLLLLAAHFDANNLRLLKSKDVPYFLGMGFAMACNVIGLIFALECMSSSRVAILQVMRPIVAAVMGWILRFERVSVAALMGAAVCMAGTVYITCFAKEDKTQDAEPVMGVIFVVVHSIGQAAYVDFTPISFQKGYTHLSCHGWAFAFASIFTAILLPFPCHKGIWWQPTGLYLEVVVGSILLVGAYTCFAMARAACVIGGTAVMMFMMFQTFLTIIGGHLILADKINYEVTERGAAMMFVGLVIFLAALPEKKKNAEYLDVPEEEKPFAKP